MIMGILAFGTCLLVSFGMYQILAVVFALPSGKAREALKNIHGKQAFLQKIESSLLNPLAKLFEKLFPMSEYKKQRMTADFGRLERRETPERFMAMILARSFLIVLIGLIFVPLGSPILTLLIAATAVMSYFHATQDIRKKVEKLNHEIEAELPRLVESLNYAIPKNRDLIAFFEKYRKVAGTALGRELDQLVFDMKTGNHSVSLRNLDARLQIPNVSALIAILCGVHQGVNQRTGLLILEQDIRTQQRERLRREAERRPGRIKAASFILTVLMIGMFMVPLILLILWNLQSVGF